MVLKILGRFLIQAGWDDSRDMGHMLNYLNIINRKIYVDILIIEKIFYLLVYI